MQKEDNPNLSARKKEIVKQYLQLLDAHIQELKNGQVNDPLQINAFAAKLFVHPVHLSHTVKEVTGQSTCDLYEERLLKISKELLLTSEMSVGNIAAQLTYDPSNFTKFFKTYTGITPKQFRLQNS
jgi:AraC family transcriptional regulator, regulatory protein of adaptative response / methylphosphotriester-DNA alkyltransferase methyltransferase